MQGTDTSALTLKAQSAIVPHEARGDYSYGDNQSTFLRTDWTWDQVLGFARDSNEPFHGLFLSNLQSDTWGVLKTLLGKAAAKEFAAMRAHCEYEDCYTGRHCPSLFPLVLLTRNLDNYAHDDGYEPRHLEFASHSERRLERELGELQSDEYGCGVRLGRIEQVLMGTGYTRSQLPSDGSANLDWQFAELTNGDILLLAGYEWFNK